MPDSAKTTTERVSMYGHRCYYVYLDNIKRPAVLLSLAQIKTLMDGAGGPENNEDWRHWIVAYHGNIRLSQVGEARFVSTDNSKYMALIWEERDGLRKIKENA